MIITYREKFKMQNKNLARKSRYLKRAQQNEANIKTK